MFSLREYPQHPPSDLVRFAGRMVFLAIMAALVALLAVLVALGVAHAQDAAVVATAIDLGPLVTEILPLLVSAVLTIWAVLRVWAFRLLKQRTGWDLDAIIGPIVDTGLNRGIDFAAERLKDRVAGGIPLNMKSQAIETVARYAVDKLPDALRHFGLVDSNGRPAPKLSEMIEARLEGLLIDPDEERASGILSARHVRSA